MANNVARATRATGSGERIQYAFAESSFGPLLLARSSEGLVWLSFADSDEKELAALAKRLPRASLEPATPQEPWIAEAVQSAESLGRREGSAALDLRGTPFQQAVWDALLAIPFGETRSYADVARSIGRPTAVRAVAQACGANPVAIIVPCHRVVGSDGSLTGYASGLTRKRALLEREGRARGRTGSSRHT